MLRFSDCNDSNLVGLDDVLTFTRPVRLPGECDLTERDFTLYLALGSTLVVARFGVSAVLWYFWLTRWRAQKLAGKAPKGIRGLPAVPLIATWGAINLSLFITLTYLGIVRANDGTSLTLLNLTFFPLLIFGVTLVRKYTGAQRRMNGLKTSRFTNRLIDGVYYSFFGVKVLITILCSIVKPGDPFWFKANFTMYAFMDYFFIAMLVGTMQQVKSAVRAKSVDKERAARVAKAITKQQVVLGTMIFIGSCYFLGMSFWWTTTWPLALGILSVEVIGLWVHNLLNHAGERNRNTRDDDAKVNNPIAAPASMFIHSHVRLGTELREGQGISQSQLVRTLVIPAKDTVFYRIIRASPFDREGISTAIFTVFIACLTITGVIVLLVALCVDIMLPLFLTGFACLLVVHVIVVLNTLTIRVCRQLLWTSSVLYRFLFALLWLLDFCDVLEWDTRCFAPVGLLLLWSLVFTEDASIKESKRWISPIIALLSASSSLCVLVIIKFDLLFRRSDHLLTLQSGAASLSWSTYQATGDFSVVLFVLLLMDAFHIVRRIGLSQLLHFKGTIYVCIVPLGSRRVFNPVSMRLMGPINFQEILAANPNPPVRRMPPDDTVTETTTITTSNESENTSPISPALLSDATSPVTPIPLSDRASPLVAPAMDLPNQPAPDILPIIPDRNPQMADAADTLVKGGILLNSKAPGGRLVPLSTVILREDDAVAVTILGKERGKKWLYWAGSPWMRALTSWANTIPVTIWVALVLPGIIPIEYSLFSIFTLLVVMRNLMLKNVHMMRVILSTRGFWLKTLLYGVSLGFFAHMLFWDVRAFTLAVMFFFGVDALLVDARCVFFVKSAKRAYEERFTALATGLYVLGNIVFTLTFVALPFVAGWGIIANARINAFIPLREEANAINGTTTIYDPTNGEIVRGTVARLNLYQFVSDFLTGMCFFIVLEFATDLRLSRKQKTRRIQLKSFHALVHPVFISTSENTTVQDGIEDSNEEIAEQRRFGSIVGSETFHEEDGNLILADGTRVYFKMS